MNYRSIIILFQHSLIASFNYYIVLIIPGPCIHFLASWSGFWRWSLQPWMPHNTGGNACWHWGVLPLLPPLPLLILVGDLPLGWNERTSRRITHPLLALLPQPHLSNQLRKSPRMPNRSEQRVDQHPNHCLHLHLVIWMLTKVGVSPNRLGIVLRKKKSLIGWVLKFNLCRERQQYHLFLWFKWGATSIS